jgi:hypothetical protein
VFLSRAFLSTPRERELLRDFLSIEREREKKKKMNINITLEENLWSHWKGDSICLYSSVYCFSIRMLNSNASLLHTEG